MRPENQLSRWQQSCLLSCQIGRKSSTLGRPRQAGSAKTYNFLKGFPVAPRTASTVFTIIEGFFYSLMLTGQ